MGSSGSRLVGISVGSTGRERNTLGQFKRSLGSTGRHSGNAAKKPTETATNLLVSNIFSRSLRSRPLFLATNSMLSGKYEAYGRCVSMYRLIASASLGVSKAIGSLKIRLGTFDRLRSPSWDSRLVRWAMSFCWGIRRPS